MPQSDFRFIPQNMYITFGSVVLSNDWMRFSYKESAELKVKTAGNEQRNSYNVATIDGEWEIELFDTAEAADALARKLRAGTRDVLAVWPKGVTTGKPLFSFWAIVQNVEKPFKFDENATVKVSGKVDGELISDIGSYQV